MVTTPLNVFKFDDVSQLGASRPVQDPKTQIDGIAARYQVPANVLMAMREAGSPDAEADARDISTAVAAGQTVDQALAAKIGDPARTSAVLNRAYDIADEMYPRTPEPAKAALEPSFGRDTFSNVVQGAVSGVGSAVRGLGQGLATAADTVNETLINRPARALTGENLLAPAPNIANGAADSLQRRAQAFGEDNISQEYRDQMAASVPSGDLLSPSTWSLGDDPSLKGYAAQAANVFGSMLPIVVAGVLSGGTGAAVAGGAQSGGAGVEGATQAIDQMAAEIGPDGRSRLEAESGTYKAFIAQGMSPAQAIDATKAEAARMAFLFTSPVGALGGALTQKIVSGTATAASRGGLGSRVAANAALGAFEEGTQEAIEGIAQTAGMNAGAGTDASLTEDTFGNFLLGAMGGGPVGALGGLAKPEQAPERGPEPPLELGAFKPAGLLPAPPPRQLPPPALITPPPSAYQQNTPAEAAAGVRPPSPDTPQADAMAANPSPAPPQAPQGPIARAAAVAPDLTPVPAPEAPPTRFPDQKPGGEVRIVDPETGAIYDAVFMREDPTGPVLRIEGNEITLTPQEFDQARLAARTADESAVTAAGGKAKPRAQSVAPATPPAAESLSQQATPTQRPPERTPEPPMTPVQAVKSMAAIRAIAKERGWNTELSTRYAGLEAIAKSGGQNATSVTADAGAGLRGEAQPDTAASRDGNPQRDIQPERDTGGSQPLAGPVAANPVDDRPATGEPPADLTSGTGPTITDIRERAAVLRGVPQDSPPVVDGVSLKWDAKEKGFIFSRKHKDKVQKALATGLSPQLAEKADKLAKRVSDAEQKAKVASDAFASEQTEQAMADMKSANANLERARTVAANSSFDVPLDQQAAYVAAIIGDKASDRKAAPLLGAVTKTDGDRTVRDTDAPDAPAPAMGETKTEDGYRVVRDAKGTVIYTPSKIGFYASSRNLPEAEAQRIIEDARRPEIDMKIAAMAKKDVPSAKEITAAAKEADPDPTDAQKEAGNYAMGHIQWNGLDITIETPKGGMRRGKGPDGKEWSVKLPAHYGYIRGTTGADGDHLDVYIGDNPESDDVFVFDQYDLKTGKFDETKTVLGVNTLEEARAIYDAGFSDGSGPRRRKGPMGLTVDQFKAWLAKDGATSKPASSITTRDVEPKLIIKSLQTGKETEVSALGPLRPGYERDIVDGKPSIEQSRMTEDGFVVRRRGNKTEVYDPTGKGIFGGAWDVPEAQVEAAIEAAQAKRIDGSAFEKIGMMPSKAAGETAWFRSQSEPGGVAQYKARAIRQNAESPWRWKLTRDFRPSEGITPPPTRQIGTVDTAAEAIAQLRENGQRMPPAGVKVDPPAPEDKAPLYKGKEIDPPLTKEDAFASGQKSFKEKYARILPDNFATMASPAVQQEWYRGWDKANLAAQVPEAETPEDKALGSPIEAGDAVLRQMVPKPPVGATLRSTAEGRKAGSKWWGGLTDQQRFVARTFGMKGTDGETAVGWWENADGGERAEVVSRADQAHGQTPPQEEPSTAANPAATGILSVLSQEKQDRAAELKAKLAAKARNQLSAGVDPEYLTLGGELVALYIEAGTKRFAQMLRDFAESTGLSMKEAQAPMRVAYNHIRDEMDLSGESVADMDTSEQVMAEIRKALAAEATAKPKKDVGAASTEPEVRGNVQDQLPLEDTNGPRNGNAATGKVGQDGKPQTGGGGNVTAGQPDGNGPDRPVGQAAAGSSGGNAGVRGGKAPRPRSGGTVGETGNGTDPAGDATIGRPPTGNVGLVDAGQQQQRDEPALPGRSNYRITDPEALFAGGPKARFRKNREALETYQRVTDEGREPTPEELDAMAAYIGWGSFGQELFQGTFEYRNAVRPEWQDEDAWLRETLGKEAWQSAQNSIINAHYTDPPTVKAIWAAIEAMGFKGGRVLEPSMGIGNFFGLMPQNLEAASQLTGIELDQTTGGMAKMLYPRANVRVMGYEKSTTPDSFYDLVIGNWPFANFSPADRRYNDLNASLHDYFFVKAVDQVRPGGLVVGITSAFSMDGSKNRNVRLHLAKRAELVAAFRLPSGAFEKYAGTKVVTDLVIYRKRETPIMDTTGETWVKSVPFKTPAGPEVNVNQYYIDNPGNILGTINYGNGTTYFKAGMIVERPDNIGELLEGIATRVPADGFKQIGKRGKEPRFVANNTTDRRFAVTVGADGALYQVLGDQMAALEDVIKYRTSNITESKAREDQFRKLVDLRQKIGAVMDADRDGAADAETKRAALKKAYQAFRKAHGPINDSYAIGVMRTKLKDPFAGLLMAMENRDGTPATIMEKSTVRAARKLDKPTIRDAFVMSRNESLMLDLDRVAELSKATLAEVTAELSAAKAIYRQPGGGFQPSDMYLAGNVRQKLAQAIEAAAQGEDMADSIAALEAVQPPDIPYFQIEARFGADWVETDINRQFVIETLGIEYTAADDVKLIRSVSGWRVELSDRVSRMRGVSDITGAPTPGKSGTGLSLRRFLEATLNTQSLSVTQSDGDGGTMKDSKATDQANAKAGELRDKFGEWVWKDPERRFEVERNYNDIMNAVATPQIDGSFMEFPGMALQRGTSAFNLRKHQSDAIWKGILNQRGIYGHEVGTGKTITMTGIAVESRRYGLAKKPLLIAHNANSSAVAAEAQETYPGAKIMYVDNLSPGEIEAQLGRMRTEDWDLIVIPHSLIDRMALTEATLMQMAADDIAAYEAEAIAAAEDEGIKLTVADMDGDAKDLTKKLFSSATAKEMVKARNRLIESIRKQAMRASKEGAVAFEDLGIDMILVDESHEFKKPPIATRMSVKGLNKGTSDRSLSLRFLTNYVKSQRGGTGVHVFTGTPLTNTLTEIYHQMYYAMDDVMRVNKVDTWDGFFKTFANTISDVEVTSTNEYESVERLAAFINVSELRRMAGQYMDIVFADDMPEFKPRTTASGKDMNAKDLTDAERAELLDGRNEDANGNAPAGRPYKKVVHDIGPMGTDQKRILQETVRYARDFKDADGKTRREIMQNGGPNAPIVFNNVPNRASMDARLHEINAEDDPNSKANRAVKSIARIYNDEDMATQVLFMDEGYSDESVSVKTNKETGEKTKTRKPKFNLVADIVEKLVREGVKREEIFVVAGGVTADQKRIIAEKMNRREIRVVIGQTRTLGVGVNMQKYLRAMHHLDAPWMPGDLEQRNGRGQRQGNTWNTVYEYRYLTESLDGRRWQVLAIKDRFIKAFLKAKAGLRTIEGDAADDAESMDSSSLGDTLAEAAGDPRLMQSNKLTKRIEKLQSRERLHSQGVADAISKAKRLRATADKEEADLPPRRADATHVRALREASAFSATVNGKTYDNRAEADAAIEAYLPKAGLQIRRGMTEALAVEVNGFRVEGQVATYASMGNVYFNILREGTYSIGKPSLSSIEAAIRRIPERLADTEATIADTRKQADRLDLMAKEPFQQQKDLDQKKADLKALKADMEANPVPAPVWLRQGAPIDTLIFADGAERVVTGHRWTDEGWFVSTAEGDVDYADAKDAFGMQLYDVRPFEAPEVLEGSKAVMGDEKPDDDAETRESRQLARPDPIPDSKVRGITIAMKAEMARAGLEGKVSAQLVRSIQSLSLGGAIGAYTTGTGNIRVSMKAGERNALGVLRHEMIHALRDSSLWGKPYGLFTQSEWQGLVKAARADADIVAWVNEAYPDEGPSVQAEEMVAEMYRLWADKRDAKHPLAKVLGKIRDFFMALAGAHRTEGFTEAADVFAAIANGTIGSRGPDGGGGKKNPPLTGDTREMRADLMAGLTKGAGSRLASLGRNWRNPSEWLTDAMAGANGYNLLALVPGRALYAELGKTLTAAKAYLKEQEGMDALRNEWHSRSDDVAQGWMKMRRKDPEANDAFMDLLHRTTLAGIDPSKPDDWKHALDGAARREVSKFGDLASDWAKDVMQQIANHERAYARLSQMFDALPADFQKMYGTLRKEYDQMGDAFEQAVLDNMENATKIAIKRAERAYNKELRRITDEGLEDAERDEAMERAEATLNSVKKRGGWGSKARMLALRKQFESNRLKGPYFPLARFGDFFVTARDAEGKVVSFSRFESVKQQEAEVQRMKDKGLTVQKGVMSDSGALKNQVDPTFVADVESMLSEAGASPEVMDMVWQRWLETLPDQSIRTSKIHRKGREGFNSDAFRAFGKHMFHGAHQLARLKHGLLMEEHLNDAREQAQIADDPNRAGLIVNEMTRRHEFAMNPQTNSTLATASSIAFIWYLGVSPAAALANLFQTTVLGPGIMAAKYGKAGMSGASVELAKAMKDFASGRGEAARAKSLTDDERLAMAEAYRRGTADKSQAHDLASVADTGIEYSAKRERIMKMIGYFFHHAERMNREVTFLAAYRLGRQEGLSHEDAVDKSAATTWTIHFDYQNSMRPRIMQGDLGRFLTMFRQYTVNMLWRLFRDAHQATRGQTAADRKEARTQLIGITLSMMAHAGIKGTWGYGLIMMLLGVFFPGGGDDAEEWLQDSLLMEGDSTGVAAWNWAMGAALQGVPGQALQISLSERIGMPTMWFRGPGSDLEGADLYNHYVGEVLGPMYGIGAGFFRGAQTFSDDPMKGIETAVPKWIRDVMKAGRYGWEGVTTRNGDPIVEDVSLYQMLVQANGFTPAQVAERYEINTRLKNEEKRLLDERRGVQQAAGDMIREGQPLSDEVIEKIRQWNMEYPEYPITPQTIRHSVSSRARASERNEFGIQLNPKLNDRLRGELPPSIYN